MRTSTAERVQKHRDTLRAAGLRPVQIWVPDTRKLEFAAECQRQVALLANDPVEAELLNWMEAGSDDEGWTA